MCPAALHPALPALAAPRGRACLAAACVLNLIYSSRFLHGRVMGISSQQDRSWTAGVAWAEKAVDRLCQLVGSVADHQAMAPPRDSQHLRPRYLAGDEVCVHGRHHGVLWEGWRGRQRAKWAGALSLFRGTRAGQGQQASRAHHSPDGLPAKLARCGRPACLPVANSWDAHPTPHQRARHEQHRRVDAGQRVPDGGVDSRELLVCQVLRLLHRAVNLQQTAVLKV